MYICRAQGVSVSYLLCSYHITPCVVVTRPDFLYSDGVLVQRYPALESWLKVMDML
jgi:hypothetical protein